MAHSTLPLTLVDVTLRDGLQSEPVVSLETKLGILKVLRACMPPTAASSPITRIELTGFSHPKWVPQFADAEAFCERAFLDFNLSKDETMAFVPNAKGMDRLSAFPIGWAAAFVSVSGAFNAKNVNRTVEESLVETEKIVERSRALGRKVRVYVSTVFGCPYAGAVPESDVVSVFGRVARMQPDEIALGDTIGVATPDQVRRILISLLPMFPKERIALHLHDTYGMAVASALTAYDAGIRRFDGSIGGIGGCPYAKGASGNAALETVAYAIAREGKANFPAGPVREALLYLRKQGLPLSSRLETIASKGGEWFL